MNCINTEFTGGDGSEMSSFPDMFVANLASVNQCGTKESTNLKFPDPGKYVTTKTQGNPYPLAAPTGTCPAGNGGSSSGSGSDSGAGSAPSSAPAVPTSQAPAHSKAPAPSSQAPAPSSQAPAPSAAPAPSQGSKSEYCADGTVPCPVPGELICIDNTHFGICDTDHCAVSQAVAPGTQCKQFLA